MVYLTILPLPQTSYKVNHDGIINELERLWKEVFVTSAELLSAGRYRIAMTKLRIISVLVEI
jgi:hypothetical protein